MNNLEIKNKEGIKNYMDNGIKKDSSYEGEVKTIVVDFYDAYYTSNRLKMYSYLDTVFQRSIPLNYFLIHSDFDIDIGILLDIKEIRVKKEENLAFVECLVEFQRNKKEVVIVLKSDYGGWKIDGKSIFKRKL